MFVFTLMQSRTHVDTVTWHSQLKTHLLQSHNEGTWLTCDICHMKLTTKQNLKVHVQRHEAVNVQGVSIQHMN